MAPTPSPTPESTPAAAAVGPSKYITRCRATEVPPASALQAAACFPVIDRAAIGQQEATE